MSEPEIFQKEKSPPELSSDKKGHGSLSGCRVPGIWEYIMRSD